MKRFIPFIMLALVAGCAAGQPFGPTLRSGCQAEEVAYVGTKQDIIEAVLAADVTPERKADLKACNKRMTAAQDACEAAPSEAAAKAMQAARSACETLLEGGIQ